MSIRAAAHGWAPMVSCRCWCCHVCGIFHSFGSQCAFCRFGSGYSRTSHKVGAHCSRVRFLAKYMVCLGCVCFRQHKHTSSRWEQKPTSQPCGGAHRHFRLHALQDFHPQSTDHSIPENDMEEDRVQSLPMEHRRCKQPGWAVCHRICGVRLPHPSSAFGCSISTTTPSSEAACKGLSG